MLRTILIIFLTVSIVATAYWGYKEHEAKNALLIHAENNYQRSFHELSYHIDLLHDQIGTSLAMNSSEKLSPQFVEIWRITSEALSNVSQLPLTLLPFFKTEEFLSNIGQFTYQTAIRDLDNEPLNQDEIKALQNLYGQAEEIKDELRQLQYTVLNNQLRWMDVELALVTDDQSQEQPIIDGLRVVEEDMMNEFALENEQVAPFATDLEDSGQFIKGKKKSEEDLRLFTKKLFQIEDDLEINVSKSGDGATVPFYTVQYEDGKNVYMDITEKGAHPIHILVDKEINEATLSLNDGLMEAENYLQQFNYKDMTFLESKQFDSIGVYTFVHLQDDVRIYPDLIQMKIALDDGELVGLNAREYVVNHRKRKLKQPNITVEEAREKLNTNVHIHEEHIALIKNDLGEDVIVYEFLGELQDETYKIFVNAMNGKEEKIEKLTAAETNFEINL